MTSSGAQQPRRSGFLSNLSSALTPPVVTDDDPSKPLVVPTGVKVATALVLLAGAVFLFLGASSLLTLDKGLDTQVAAYNSAASDCTAKYGGVNGKAKAPANATADVKTQVDTCNKNYPEPQVTQAMKDTATSRYTLVSWVLIVVGIVSLGAGWFLRTGTAWARRAAIGLVVVTMILTMFLGVSNLLTMAATLFLVVAVLLCYLGRGAGYFAMTLMRRRAA